MRVRAHVVAALATGLLASGCSAGVTAPGEQPQTTTAPLTAAPMPAPVASPVDEDGRQDAVDVAVAALVEFVADRPYEQWWDALAPHLTATGRQAYETVEPAWIPASRVTDQGQLAAFPDGTSATVLVGTDIGQYRVDLIRETSEYPWQVERITPPEGD